MLHYRMKGDRDKGRDVFAKVCAVCHRLDGVGKVVGPNLAGLNNRAPATYLTAILDPNRAVEAKWMMFVAKTKDGLTSSRISGRGDEFGDHA